MAPAAAASMNGLIGFKLGYAYVHSCHFRSYGGALPNASRVCSHDILALKSNSK